MNNTLEKKEVKLSNQEIRSTFIRSNFLGATHNYERMQALGAYYAMVPTLKKIYADRSKDERAEAIRRHLEFFNTNPYVYGPVLGMTMAMEENTDEEEKDSVIAVRTALMGPLAGLGDSLLALTLVPIFLSIGAGMAMEGNPLGPILFIALFSLTIWPVKWIGLNWGYSSGTEVLSDSKGTDIIERISRMGNVVGIMVAAALIVSTVNINVPIEYSMGESTIIIQEMLDEILPNLLPLLLTLGIYRLIKNKEGKNVVKIIVGLLVIGVLLSMIGILG